MSKEPNPIFFLSKEEKLDLTKRMFKDISLFVEVCFADTISKLLSDEEKVMFANGELDRETYMPEYQQDIYKLYDSLLKGDLKNLALVLFREAAKSTMKRLVTCFCICFGLEPYIMYIAETQGQAVKDLESVKYEIEKNDALIALFGDMKGGMWNALSATFKSPNGKETYIETAGFDTAIRGTNRHSQRPTLVFSDDFESKENSNTLEQRDKVATTIGSKIMRMGDSTDYKLVFMGTIVHHKSYLSKIKTIKRFNCKTGAYYEKMVSDSPSIYTDPHTGIRRSEGYSTFKLGKLAWPKKYPKEFLEEELQYYGKDFEGGRCWWEALQELYNIPQSSSEPVFNADMIQEADAKLKRYGTFSWIERRVDGKTVKTAITVIDGYDPAAGRGEKHDRTLKCTVGLLPNDDLIILDIVAEKLKLTEQRDVFVATAKKYAPKRSVVETFGFQLSLVDFFKDHAKAKKVKVNIIEYARKGLNGKGGKLKSILSGPVNGGKICYIKGCNNIKLLKQEMGQFGSGGHDDTLDGLFLCVWGANDMHTPDINVDMKVAKLMKVRAMGNLPGQQGKKRIRNWMTN